MKKYSAIAIIEFRDIASGIYATDAMLKRSPISLLKCGVVTHGRYLTLIGGNTASVDEATHEGLLQGGASVIDHVMLPDVHPQVHAAILGERAPAGYGSLAIIETATVSCNVRAAELALKGTPVELVEIRLAELALSGKGVSLYRGDLPDIEAAVDLAVSFLNRTGVEVVHRIIPAPNDVSLGHIATAAYFGDREALELDGEVG